MREGVDPRSVRLPDRILGKPPLKRGPLAGVTLDNEAMIEDYYRHLQWDPATGRPTKERLKELGLADVAAAIQAGGGRPAGLRKRLTDRARGAPMFFFGRKQTKAIRVSLNLRAFVGGGWSAPASMRRRTRATGSRTC